jgi:DNA-directed RNA polymerase specialized sigma24 family protein
LTHAEIAGRLGVSVRTIDRFMVKAWDHVRGNFGTEFEG